MDAWMSLLQRPSLRLCMRTSLGVSYSITDVHKLEKKDVITEKLFFFYTKLEHTIFLQLRSTDLFLQYDLRYHFKSLKCLVCESLTFVLKLLRIISIFYFKQKTKKAFVASYQRNSQRHIQLKNNSISVFKESLNSFLSNKEIKKNFKPIK